MANMVELVLHSLANMVELVLHSLANIVELVLRSLANVVELVLHSLANIQPMFPFVFWVKHFNFIFYCVIEFVSKFYFEVASSLVPTHNSDACSVGGIKLEKTELEGEAFEQRAAGTGD
jgi:hypothetical protein